MGRNIRAVLGDNPFLWCWPQPMRGSGLKFPVAEGTGKWIEFRREQRAGQGDPAEDEDAAADDERDNDRRPPSRSRRYGENHYDAPPYAGGQPSDGLLGGLHEADIVRGRRGHTPNDRERGDRSGSEMV